MVWYTEDEHNGEDRQVLECTQDWSGGGMDSASFASDKSTSRARDIEFRLSDETF
jgi:hypothetical protein